MSVRYIDKIPCELLASARPAGLPFCEQDGELVGCDFGAFDGSGMCNYRFTREQAMALRDVLHAYLTRGSSVTIGKAPDGKLMVEELAYGTGNVVAEAAPSLLAAACSAQIHLAYEMLRNARLGTIKATAPRIHAELTAAINANGGAR